jgi:enoyl-CoA hydratase/carnithine racemase
MPELVTIEIDNGVADIRLNRPDKYNSLSKEMFRAIESAGKSICDNKSIRAVVLSGNGKGFCAGLDLEMFQPESGLDESMQIKSGDIPNLFQNVAFIWKKVPVPVIAAIHGVAYGGGFQIAMGADIRIAAPDAKLSVMEIKWGLIPDMSASQTLRDLVRLDIAKELTFTGRIVDATEAKEIGLITRISETPLEAALVMAKEIANKSPDAISAGKKLLESAWHGDTKEGLELEQDLQIELLGKPNQIESIMANLEKRDPIFSSRK